MNLQEKKSSKGIILIIVATAAVLLGGLTWFAWRKDTGGTRPGAWTAEPQSTTERNESAALGVLNSFVLCLDDYARTHPESGYPRAVEQLGPTGSGCLDADLTASIARGETVSGYDFTYTPVPLEGRNEEFELQARPHRYRTDGVNSFFLDQLDFYMVRVTAQDRAAGSRDPLLN